MNPIELRLRTIFNKVRDLSLPPLARQVRKKNLTYLNAPAFHRIRESIEQIRKKEVPGDFVEFGMALGGSAIYLASEAGGRGFRGYDMFGLIPPPTDQDDEKSKNRYELISSGKSTGIGGELYYGYQENLFEKVSNSFAEFGYPVDGKKISLYKGLFEETLAFSPGDKVALAHLDCDWYNSVKFCLEATDPVLSVGGIMILDDYNFYGGCRKATDEFVANNKNYVFVHTKPSAGIMKIS
jgi:asparagine synthase (glutamine-hydrolysing)